MRLYWIILDPITLYSLIHIKLVINMNWWGNEYEIIKYDSVSATNMRQRIKIVFTMPPDWNPDNTEKEYLRPLSTIWEQEFIVVKCFDLLTLQSPSLLTDISGVFWRTEKPFDLRASLSFSDSGNAWTSYHDAGGSQWLDRCVDSSSLEMSIRYKQGC